MINRLWIQPTIFYVIFVAIGFAWLIDLWNTKVIEKLSQNETFNRLNGDIGQTGPGLSDHGLFDGRCWTTFVPADYLLGLWLFGEL